MPTALITGGSRGIGHETARLLSQNGWTVIAPPRSRCDLTDRHSVHAYMLSLIGTVSVESLVLNAHAWYAKPFTDQTVHDIDVQWGYVRQHWMLLQMALRNWPLKNVVLVSSMRGLIGGVDSGPYAMAKAALIALGQGFAREYHGKTRFNVVCPGLTATDMEAEVRATGGVSNPQTIAQSPACVATLIYKCCIHPSWNGKVFRINQGRVEEMAWQVSPS